jgi:hypothetical protein
MKKITVGFMILLTICLLSLTLVPSALSQTSSIKIVSYSYYIDSSGYLDVVGEVQNVGSSAVDPIFLVGTVTLPDGTQTNSYPTKVWVLDLIPQQKAPFYMEFLPPQNTNFWQLDYVSDLTLNVIMANATSEYQYPDLTITKSSGSIGTTGDFKGAYVVNGEIQNTGTQAATNLTVVGTFFNSTGAVVGVGHTNYLTPTVLNPSATASFQIAALDLNQTIIPSSMKISSYSLLVQTQKPILQGTAPLATPSSSTTTSPSSTSQSSQLFYAIVIVVVIVVIAAALLFLKKRSKPQVVRQIKSKPLKTKK